MNSFLAMSVLDSCTGWLGALILVVVGGLVVRKADTTAGMALAGAGLLKLLLNCCLIVPNLAFTYGGFDLDPAVFTTNMVLVQLQRLAFFGLLAFAITRLGKQPEAHA